MNALDEMRSEASRMTDNDIAVILEMAFRSMHKDRWTRLRKGLAEPENAGERAYLEALRIYVYHKLAIRRETNFYGYPRNRHAHEVEMNQARNKMDRIESGVPESNDYIPSENPEHSLLLLTAHDAVNVIGKPGEVKSALAEKMIKVLMVRAPKVPYGGYSISYKLGDDHVSVESPGEAPTIKPK